MVPRAAPWVMTKRSCPTSRQMTISSCEEVSRSGRLIALIRNRIQPTRVAPLRASDIEIDALNARVRRGTRSIRLSPAEHLILYTVTARGGAVISYREIAEALGRTELDFRHNTLARHVSSLRRKLGDAADRPRYIETVTGVGYRLPG